MVWFDELVGDVTKTAGVLVMRNMPTPQQTELVCQIMPRVHRLCIDKTGMGLPIFETMERDFYGQIEGVTFTQQTKETMATQIKRRLEEKRCRLPEAITVNGTADDQILWQSFRSVRKTSTALGQVRFDAGRDYDHADLFWAKCLAEAAAAESPEHGLISYWRKQFEERNGRTAPVDEATNVQQELAQAQRRAAFRSGIFGEDKFLIARKSQRPKRTPPKPVGPKTCPECGSLLAAYSEFVRCNQCRWSNTLGES